MMETGLSLKQDAKTGRDSQSRAFFNTPGMPWLYSGVEIRTPSQDEIKRLSAFTAETPVAVSRSSLYRGMSLRVTTWMLIEVADFSVRILINAGLKDALRRLPKMPTILTTSFVDSDIAISLCPYLNRWCVRNLLVEESEAGEMTVTKKRKHPTTAAFLKKFITCASNWECFCVSQGTCDIKVAQTPLRSWFTVVSAGGWGSQPPIWRTRQRHSGEVRGSRR